MQLYFFTIVHGRQIFPELVHSLDNDNAAQREAGKICADLARDIVLQLQPNNEWRIDVANEKRQKIFALKLGAEVFDKSFD